jgi:putative Mg2+ transporter-C (MgtC) family protein
MEETTLLWHWLKTMAPTVLISILCGGLIGIERQLKNKAAGVKTNILICVGAALYAMISILLSNANQPNGGPMGDPARVAAQIVSGIGFLGGGAIVHSRGTVVGLTTAATIWVVAAIGLLIGIGYPVLGIIGTLAIIAILTITDVFEDRVLGRSMKFQVDLQIMDPDGRLRQEVQTLLLDHELTLEDFSVSPLGEMIKVDLVYSGKRVAHTKFMGELWALSGVKGVRSR